MKDIEKMELTVNSEYKIYSLAGRENVLESEGVFKGFISIGVDETGLLLELNEKHENMTGKTRIIPLHVILAIDILKAEENQKIGDDKEMSHYVG